MAKILIVDDNEGVLKMVSSILQSRGHNTVSCLEPRDAIEKMQKEFFEVVITDIMMPGGVNGFDFVRTIRAEKNFESIPVIFLTGRRDRKDVEKAVQIGGDDYVIKPIDPDILISKVESLVMQSPRRSENFVAGTVNQPATWDVATEILKVTEVGLEIRSTLPAMPGAKVKLRSPFFEKIDLEPPFLRVISCDPILGEEGKFSLKVHFVGLGEREMSVIRMWIRNSKLSKAA